MTTPAQPPLEFRYRIHYTRHGASIYQAHLDLMEALLRAVRRSGLPYALTQGCHTRPKTSFGPPLPLGQASRCEFFDLYLSASREPEAVAAAFSGLLPEGMNILRAESVALKAPMLSGDHRVRYRLPFTAGAADTTARVRAFLSDPERAFILRRGSEARQYVIGSAVLAIREEEENGLPGLTVDFSQGGKGQPSVSKIITALAEELGPEREALLGVERICFLE
ncbi:MAG TPA: TIGR03936 family radical SAM-associated protein [Candidatus Ozemobacteraceae bacterium]|nr:TIGR03936 family radical SAM-associated protein [Candidatus Ozemobacteraceae bacterium]